MRRISGDVTLPDAPKAGVGTDRPAGLPHRYRIADVIGEGGMGRVFRAHDAVLGREVAIKVIEIGVGGTDGTKQRERFAREARAAARLAHPNIVGVHDVDPEAGWLVMDLVEGESLKDLGDRGASPPPLVRKIAEQVLSALDAAHAAGVIHRDIKPSNVIVDGHGKATLVDFGVARLVDAEMTRTGETIGTPAYMAPEQLRGGTIDERTDLYGLGATLFELVTGNRMVAFESPSEAALAKLAASCANDPALARVITRCLQGDPLARPPSARHALAELATKIRRRRWWVVPAALGIMAIGGVASWLLLRGDKEDPRLAHAFANAQRGEHEKAELELDDYLTTHPDDARALTLKVLVHWSRHGTFEDKMREFEPKLEPAQRAMVRGIDLLSQRKEPQAIAYLEGIAVEHPDSVEVAFALGEARWHAGYLERGLAMLEQAFDRDPRWMLAVHHVIEYRLARGEADKLVSIANRMRQVDPPRAAALECEMAIARRQYPAAAGIALTAVVLGEAIPELYTCMAHAHVLSGELAQAELAARQMMDMWTLDLREWGGFAMENELLLYRGRYAEYVDKLRGKPSRQRDMAAMLWDPAFAKQREEVNPGMHPYQALNTFGMRGPPLGSAMIILAEHLRGRDSQVVYAEDPQAEVRAYGKGLGAWIKGDTSLAIAELSKALAAPAKGDMRMMIGHALGKVYHAQGNVSKARDACREVLEPAQYYAYRAVLLPDCVLWSGDRAGFQRFLEMWTGELQHPAVVEMRRRLRE